MIYLGLGDDPWLWLHRYRRRWRNRNRGNPLSLAETDDAAMDHRRASSSTVAIVDPLYFYSGCIPRRLKERIVISSSLRHTNTKYQPPTLEGFYDGFFHRPPAPPTSTSRCVWRRCDNRRSLPAGGGSSGLAPKRGGFTTAPSATDRPPSFAPVSSYRTSNSNGIIIQISTSLGRPYHSIGSPYAPSSPWEKLYHAVD